MDQLAIVPFKDYFAKLQKEEPDTPSGIIGMKTLMWAIQVCPGNTMYEMLLNLQQATSDLQIINQERVQIKAGCDMFIRFVTLAVDELEAHQDFKECAKVLLSHGAVYIQEFMHSRERVVEIAMQSKLFERVFREVKPLKVITYSYSPCVLEILKKAVGQVKLEVYLTKCSIDNSGELMAQKLRECNIDVHVYDDAYMGYVAEQGDFVLLGAEAVVKDGGFLNRTGTCSLVHYCKEKHKRKVYVAVECFKYFDEHVWNFESVWEKLKYPITNLHSSNIHKENPHVDYTPPELIDYYISERGIIGPYMMAGRVMNTMVSG